MDRPTDLPTKAPNLLGQTFGNLEVIAYGGRQPYARQRKSVWLCQCCCGNIITVLTDSLTSGRTKSCNDRMKHPLISLKGHTFGLLTVIEFVGLRQRGKRHNQSLWRCLCACGREKIIGRSFLTSGQSRSCGCRGSQRSTSGVASQYPVEHAIWTAMWQRCTNPHSTEFKNYGARGITVDERWKSFDQFFSDLGPRPSQEYQLERTNNDWGYGPENTIWGTIHQQNRNKRSNIWIVFQGRRQCLEDWSKERGIPTETLRYRYRHAWHLDVMMSPGKKWAGPEGHKRFLKPGQLRLL